MGDTSFRRQVFGHHVLDTADRLSANTYIYLNNFGLELCLQLLDDVGQTLSGFVNVIDVPLADKRRRVLFHHGEYGDATIEVLLTCDTGHL